MRAAWAIMVLGFPLACDAEIVREEGRAYEPAERGVEPGPGVVPDGASSGVTLAPVASLGEVDCFAAVEAEGGALVAAIRDGGRVELLTVRAEDVTSEPVTFDGGPETPRAGACALSLDARGVPEIAVAWEGGPTIHLRREPGGWAASTVAPFGATHIAMNARSPRGTDVIVTDGRMTSAHVVRSGAEWVGYPLPAVALAVPGALAVAVTADTDGRSHFALGCDYYGDRDGQYVFWPGACAPAEQPRAGLAIALSPTDPERLPHIVHARTEPVVGNYRAVATHLYRTVIGPDAALTTRWASARTVVGEEQHLAVAPGRLAARFDAEGYLHTVAAIETRTTRGGRWSLAWDHDRGGAPVHTALPGIRATGAVALVGELVLARADRELDAYRRSNVFGAVAVAERLAPPSVGAVDSCAAGFAKDGVSAPLRQMTGLSHVALAIDDASGELHALEWAWDRQEVRHTVGHEAGWQTTDVTPWQLEVMRPMPSRVVVGPDGDAHAFWIEGELLVHWSDASGAWSRDTVALGDTVGATAGSSLGAPSAAFFGGDLWLAAPAQGSGLVLTRRADGAWEAPIRLAIKSEIEAHAFIADEVPTVLVAERGNDHEVRLALYVSGAKGWDRRPLGFSAARIDRISGFAGTEGLVAAVATTLADGRREIVLVAVPEAQDASVIARWDDDGAGAKALFAGPLAGGGVRVAWDREGALAGARVLPDGTVERDHLALTPGARLWAGLATRDGRLVAVENRGAETAVVGQACAPATVARKSHAR